MLEEGKVDCREFEGWGHGVDMNRLVTTKLTLLFKLQYGEPVIRRAVPLALAMLSASNPQLSIMDMLSKLSHDNDAEVAHNSIFAMGIVAAGTNNARLAGMLRQLAQYYNKDASNLFMVRLAQVES